MREETVPRTNKQGYKGERELFSCEALPEHVDQPGAQLLLLASSLPHGLLAGLLPHYPLL